MAVQAIKGVEIGLGFEAARRRGSQVHDPIHYDESKKHTPHLGYERPTNNAGGLEAGMTNGQPLVIRAAKKPISTLRKPLASINLDTKEAEGASYERSDVCAISAASVIVENVVAFEIAAALVDKFGGDSLQEMQARYKLFMEMAAETLTSSKQPSEPRASRSPRPSPLGTTRHDLTQEHGCSPSTKPRANGLAARRSSPCAWRRRARRPRGSPTTHLPWRDAAAARRLSDRYHLDVLLADWQDPRPSMTRLAGVTLAEPGAADPLLKLAGVETHRRGDALILSDR